MLRSLDAGLIVATAERLQRRISERFPGSGLLRVAAELLLGARETSARHETASSPERPLTPFELGRYLDYCSELLSVTSKVAALYAQRIEDPVVLEAVNEVETLTTGLSAKI